MLGIIFLLSLSVYICFAVDVTAPQGETVRLTCSVHGNKFAWGITDNTEVLHQLPTDSRYEGRAKEILSIKNVNTKDSGMYRCYAMYENGTIKGYGSIITVTVTGPANWGRWGAWNSCPVTCGGGQRISKRFCDNPPPSAGGSNCIGSNQKTDVCATNTCPVHGNWGRWGAWNRCTVTCGDGQQISNRVCNDPSPSDGGSACSGDSKMFRSCAFDECPVHGNWGGWGAWNRCPVTCGGSRQISNRACNDPSPSGGGSACSGNSKKFRSCATNKCPVHGNWGGWGAWNRCPVTCGGGRQTSNRACDDPSPSGGGSQCSGASKKFRNCANNKCPEWTNWNLWGTCIVNCGYGTRSRNRYCKQCQKSNCMVVDNRQCSGNADERATCPVVACTGRSFDSLTIGCDLKQNRRTVAWSQNGNYIRDIRNKYEGTTSNLLQILNLQYTDNGNYRCSFWDGQTHNYGKFINLNVYGIPQVTILRQSHVVQIGTTVTLVCNIESNPPASQVWWTDNKTQHITDKRRYNGGNIHNHNLSIISARDSDSGVYTCNAKNPYGTSNATTTLMTGSTTETTILKDYYVAINDQEITMECLIKTDSSNKKLYWLKNGDDIRPYVSSKYSGGTLSEPSLTVKNVDNYDAGNYTCKLEYLFGTSEDVVELKVLSVHVDNPVNINIRANDTVTLQCVATGGNNVAWRRNNQIIDTTSSVRYRRGNVNTPSLTITNVTRYHAGNYTCETSYDLVKVISKKAIQLFVKDTPLVYQSSDNIQASTGSTVKLKCVYESYPEPSVVFWKRDGEILNVTISKYNGSSINVPSLTLVNIDQFDAGTYVCAVVNGVGIGYSSKILLKIKEKELKSANKVPVVIGTVLSVAVFLLILFTVLMILMKRKRVKKRQESSYETNEMINAETHAYGKTDTYHEYCNSNIKQTPATYNDISLMEGDCLFERYNVSELTKRLNDAESLKARIRAEFMFLESNSVKIDIPIDDYEIVLKENQTGLPTKESKTLYMKQSGDDMFIFSSLPDDGNVEQFWSMVIDKQIENIIMIVQKNEKTTSFCPTQDDVFKVAMLEIEMRSAEKTNDNIFMLRFTLHNKKSRTKHHVKIFKTNWDDSDKYPSVESICSLLDKVKIEEGRQTLMTGSKGKSFSVCAAVSLCLQSVRAIERDTAFSLLEYATLLKRIEDNFIKVFRREHDQGNLSSLLSSIEILLKRRRKQQK